MGRSLLVYAGLALAGMAWASGTVVLAPAPGAPWQVVGLPMQRKPYTAFEAADLDGERVLRVVADKSYGTLVHTLPPDTAATGLSWRWRVDEPIVDADLRRKAGDDSAIQVCALFDLPLERVPFVERQVLRALRLRGNSIVPSASVCYVWDSHFAAGTVLTNAYTRRVRIIVLRGEGAPPKTWTSEQRDLGADFLQLFSDESNVVPPLAALAIAADADNTQSHSLAYVDALQLRP